MSNPNNYAILRGTLVRDPKLYEYKNGNKSVSMKIAVKNSWKNRDGEYGTQYIPVRASVDASVTDNKNPFLKVKEGDFVTMEISLRNKVIDGKDGKNHYEVEAFCETITFGSENNANLQTSE